MQAEAEDSSKPSSSRAKKIAVACLWLSFVVFVPWFSQQHNLGPLEIFELVALKIKSSFWGPVLFVLAYTLLPLLFFSATALTVISGAIFGPLWGLIYTALGTSVSSSVAYLIGKFFGRDFIEGCRPGSLPGKCAQKLQGHSFSSVLLMRCLLVPFDLVNYIAGAVGVHYPAFLSATILGSLAPMVFFVHLGHSTGLGSTEAPELNPLVLVGSLFIMLLGLVLSKLWNKKAEQKNP